MAVINLSPLSSSANLARFPQVSSLEGEPPVPKPILESALRQSFSLLLIIPILALDLSYLALRTFNPSLLQLSCKEACEAISFFHVSRPREVARYVPSAISEYSELADLFIGMKLFCSPIFIPRQILVKDVFQ